MNISSITNGNKIKYHTIDSTIARIGRGASNNIIINDRKVSKNHLLIIQEKDLYKIKDLGSTNGTYLDSQKIKPGTFYVINENSNIKIGDTVLNIIKRSPGRLPDKKKSKNKVLLSLAIGLPIIIVLIIIFSIIPRLNRDELAVDSSGEITQEGNISQEELPETTEQPEQPSEPIDDEDIDEAIEIEEIMASVVEIYTIFNSGEEVYGTGMIFSSDGYIVTNHHLIQNPDVIMVRDCNDNQLEAKVITSLPEIDISLIKIEGNNLSIPEFGDSSTLRVRDKVIAIGNPFGLTNTVTEGIISAIRDIKDDSINLDVESAIQHDAAMNLGNSGGPLLNKDGRVIGINAFIITPDLSSTGLGFAIPINLILNNINKNIDISINKSSTDNQSTPYQNNFKLSDINGNLVNLSDYQGKVVVLNFFAVGCPPCREEIPDFIEVYDDYKDKNVIFVGVSLDEDINVLKSFISDYGINYPVLIDDGNVSNEWHIEYIPATFILDENGNKLNERIGYLPKEELATYIQDALE